MKENYLGEFEDLVLRAVWRLGDDAYGVPLRQTLEEATGRSVSIGALYTTLERLEKKGYVKSRVGEKTAERGGRAKKFFKIEGLGMQALAEAEQARVRVLPDVRVLQPIGGAA